MNPYYDGNAQYKDFAATELFCPKCRRSMPVREFLLLVLPDGDVYDYRCARCGTSLKGCVIYCAWPPCTDCARGIIQAGIVEVVVRSLNCVSRWADDMAVALEMLDEAGVKLRVVECG